MEQMTETDSTCALLQELCRVLGEGWIACREAWNWRLRGREYDLLVERRKGQLHIRPFMPYELSKHARYEAIPHINVGPTRSATAIAADIKRRLLPAASEVYAKLVERQAKAVEFERGQWLILDTLADALGVEHLDRERGFAQSVHWTSSATSRPYTSAWLTAGSNDEVEIKVSGVPLDIACEICRLLTGRGD